MSEARTETADPTSNGLYRVCGVATIVMMALFLFDVVIWFTLGPSPKTAEGWFALLQDRRHVGLLLLSFPTFFGAMLYYLTFFGLHGALRSVNRAYASLAALLAFVGLTVMLATSIPHRIVHLADRCTTAMTEQQREQLLAAGETAITSVNTGVNVGGLFVESAAVLFSILMLRSKVFGKIPAYLGIVGHGLDLTRIVMALAFLPEGIGAVLLMIGGLPQLIWLVLVGLTLFQMGSKARA